MQRSMIGAAVFLLLGSLLVGEAMAFRGGGRSLAGGGISAVAGRHGSGSGAGGGELSSPSHAGAVAAAATAASVAAWLGVAYTPTETVIATSNEQYNQQYNQQYSELHNVQTTQTQPYANPSVAGEEPPPASDASPAEDAQWMSLGVFEIMPAGLPDSNRVVQLAVDREGVVRGTLYDRISDEMGDLHGAIDKRSLQVTWTIGEHGDMVFEIPLAELSKPQGSLTIHFPDGTTGDWRTRPLAEAASPSTK